MAAQISENKLAAKTTKQQSAVNEISLKHTDLTQKVGGLQAIHRLYTQMTAVQDCKFAIESKDGLVTKV